MKLRRMMGQMKLGLSNNKFTHKHILSSKSLLTQYASRGHSVSYLWHIGLKLHTHLDESCIYHVSKYYIDILHYSYNIVNLLHHTNFLDTQYITFDVRHFTSSTFIKMIITSVITKENIGQISSYSEETIGHHHMKL